MGISNFKFVANLKENANNRLKCHMNKLGSHCYWKNKSQRANFEFTSFYSFVD